MDDGSQARTRGEDLPPRPGGPDDEQPFPDPEGMAGQEGGPGGTPDDRLAAGAPAEPGDPGDDERIRSVEIERDEYLDALRRLQADFENYRKRVSKQQLEEADRAARSLVDKLLPVLDVLDLAAAHLGDPTSDDGRALVQATALLNDVLTKEGLERIDPIGEPFDPSLHEAVGQLPAETGEPDGSPAGATEPSTTVADEAGRDGPSGNVSDDALSADDQEDAGVSPGEGTDDIGGIGGRGGGSSGSGDAGGSSGSGDAGDTHETGGGDTEGGPGHEVLVAQVMRAGYRWKGAVVRPAMVMVRG